MHSLSTHQLEVADDLRPFAANALDRLSYLHPDWKFRIEASLIIAETGNAMSEKVIHEIRYALYREKILAETMDLRRDLLRMVTRS